MRAPSLLRILMVLSVATGAYAPLAAAAPAPDQQADQIAIALFHYVVKKGALKAIQHPVLTPLPRKGLVTAEPSQGVQASLASLVLSGKVLASDVLAKISPPGEAILLPADRPKSGLPLVAKKTAGRVIFQFSPGGPTPGPALAGSVIPRLAGECITADLHFAYGTRMGPVHTGQSIHETVTIASGGTVLLHFGATDGGEAEQVVLLTLTRTGLNGRPR
ncbi:MAG TPA: hypothetical protein VK689_09230 [Armatimonadota bacterium]|nr:hypothetical protein [Armatimonadota bacterium]